MSKKSLNRSDIGSPLEKMSGETVAKGMGAYPLMQSGFLYSGFYGFVD